MWQLEVLAAYVHGRLLQIARGDMTNCLEVVHVLKKAKKEKRLQDREEKALHGQCLRQTKEVKSEQSQVYPQNGDLKRETVAAQNQSIRTNLAQTKADKSQKDMLCRLCKKADKSKKTRTCKIIDFAVCGNIRIED